MTGFYMSTLVPDSRINSALNEVYQQVLAAEPWSWLVSQAFVPVSPLSPSVTLEQCRHVLSVALTDGSRSWVTDRSSRTSPDWLEPVESEPVRWAFMQPDTLLLNPAPTKSYDVHVQFVARGLDLTVVGTPVFAPEYHTMLAYGAAALLLVQENDETNRAQTYSAMFTDYLSRMRADDNHSSLSAVQMGSKPRARARRYLTWGR
jgi:hypothetical protein